MAIGAGFWPFRRSRAQTDAALLLSTVTQIARQPGFYGEGRVADTLEGRLALMNLHGALAFIRLNKEPACEPMTQVFADQLFRHFDAGLREAGVGDLTVPKRMRKIAGAFYGQLGVYGEALKQDTQVALEAALARNVLCAEAGSAPFAASLAAYVRLAAQTQAEAPHEALFRLDGWPQAPA